MHHFDHNFPRPTAEIRTEIEPVGCDTPDGWDGESLHSFITTSDLTSSGTRARPAARSQDVMHVQIPFMLSWRRRRPGLS